MKRKALSLILAAAMAFNLAIVPVSAEEIIVSEEALATETISEDLALIEEVVTEDSIIEETVDEDSAFAEEVSTIKEASKDYVLSEEQVADKAELLARLNDMFLTDSSSVEEVVKEADAIAESVDSECSIESIAESAAPYAKGEVVYLTDTYEDALKVAESIGGTVESFEYGVAVIKIPDNTTTAQVVCAAALPDTNIPMVTPNFISTTEDYNISDITDPYVFSNSGSDYQWQIDFVGAKTAWEKGYTGKGIKVAVLDTGVQRDHSDLTANCTKGKSFINGKTGTEFNDDTGYHGTHVAGIIAADDNGILGCGVAPDATVTSFAVLNGSTGYNSDIVKAINAVVADGSYKIINMSLGGSSYDTSFNKAVTNATNAGIAVFCAAGNAGTTRKDYPASYDDAISIAALDSNGKKASYSQYNDAVDFCFPGTAINSANKYDLDGYTKLNGTSMATPCAAGVAAIILQSRPDLVSKKTKASVTTLRNIMASNVIAAPQKNVGVGTTDLTKISFDPATPVTPPTGGVEKIELSGPSSIRAGKSFTVTAVVSPEDAENKKVTLSYKDSDKHITIKGMQVTVSSKASGSYTVYASSEDGCVVDVPFTFNVTKGYITSIAFDKKSLSLFTVAGNSSAPTSYALTTKVRGKSDYDSEAIKYVSSDPTVATVDEYGKITAVSEGKVTIACKSTDGTGKIARCSVTVKVPMSKITIGKGGDFSQTNITVKKKGSTKLSKQVETAYGTPTSTAVKWSSDSKKIQINSKGVITVKKGTKSGTTATITAKATDGSGLTGQVTVTVQ